MGRKGFNDIYERLVSDEEDIVGQIAYSLYKAHKLDVIAQIKQEKGLDHVPEKDLEPFLAISRSDRQIALYKIHAQSLAQQFIDEAMSGERQTLDVEWQKVEQKQHEVDQALEEQKRRLEEDFLRSHKNPGFWYGVWQGIVASLIFVLTGLVLLLSTGGWARFLKILSEALK